MRFIARPVAIDSLELRVSSKLSSTVAAVHLWPGMLPFAGAGTATAGNASLHCLK